MPARTIAIASILLVAATTHAQWPQFGGPTRDFKVPARDLADAWPADGPKKLWQREIGDGYSAILADGGALFTMTHREDKEIVIALDAKSGKTLWEHAYTAEMPPDMNRDFGPGPRATPLLAGDRIFAVGISGLLHALDKKSGQVIWKHDLAAEYKAKMPYWGYSSSPLAYGDTIILPVGGPGHAVVAFQQSDGKIAWARGDDGNAYSSPVLAKVDGQEQVIVFMTDVAIGLDPKTGTEYWRHPHKTFANVNATMPLLGDDNLLFLTSAYGTGARCLKLRQSGGKTTVEEVWADNKFGVHHGTVIRIGDVIYGSLGMVGPAFFAAINVKTGEGLWRVRDFAKATMLLAGDKFIILDESGALGLATPTESGLRVLANVDLLERAAWTVPTLVNKTLFIRDRKTMMALDLGAK